MDDTRRRIAQREIIATANQMRRDPNKLFSETSHPERHYARPWAALMSRALDRVDDPRNAGAWSCCASSLPTARDIRLTVMQALQTPDNIVRMTQWMLHGKRDDLRLSVENPNVTGYGVRGYADYDAEPFVTHGFVIILTDPHERDRAFTIKTIYADETSPSTVWPKQELGHNPLTEWIRRDEPRRPYVPTVEHVRELARAQRGIDATAQDNRPERNLDQPSL